MARRSSTAARIAFACAFACACALAYAADPASAQQANPGANSGASSAASSRGGDGSRAAVRAAASSASSDRGGLPPLPEDRTTDHSVSVGGRTIDFSATAGTIRLANARDGSPLADVAYIAYVEHGEDARRRPVVFVFNGGPGYASGWLDLGGLGPWRLPMDGAAAAPSAPPEVMDNQETWLDFADLVFIDPPGTGYSRVLGGEDVRKALWSVKGDVDALSTVVRRWVEQNNRMASPKFIAGESYGGFRAPKIAHELTTDQGVGIAGLAMISPVLEFSRFEDSASPFHYASALPSLAAVAREQTKPISRADLADVEQYARGDLLADLMKGPNDSAAVGRLSARVAQLTGLDATYVRRLGGRVDADDFRREFWRAQGRIASQYDGSVAGWDPTPFDSRSRAPDQLRIGLNAPIVEAMVDMYHTKLDWIVPRGRWQFLNDEASRSWDWGKDAEALGDLREDLALDPKFKVLIAQGLTDLITPYFGTQLELDQIPNYGPSSRIDFDVLPGGHMVYIRDASRKALQADARKLIAPPAPH